MTPIPTRVRERLLANAPSKSGPPYYVINEDGCWIWQRGLTYGHGVIQWRDGPRNITRRAHRIMYRLLVGPIPDGLDLDHMCHNRAVARGECDGGDGCPHRACVNPDHMEPTTRKENARRGAGHGNETHCPRGHPYDEENTYTSKAGHRRCRECTLASNRRSKRRTRA